MDTSKLTIAAAAAALFLAGCADQGATKTAAADSAKVKCYGANACKGQAECKTAMNECKGQNACKAQGYVMLEEGACLQQFGRS